MTIEVRIYDDLRYYLADSGKRDEGNRWEVEEGTTLGQVLGMLNLPKKVQVLLLLNGSPCNDEEKILQEGDIIFMHPLLEGG